LVAAVQARGVVALALVAPGGDGHEVERAQAAKVDGIVLEGEFPEGTAAGIKDLAVIELTSRSRLQLGSAAPVLGTYQGVWPGISADEEGAKKSGPTSGVWIDTNTGFLRAVRAWGNATVWIANQPPPKTAVAATRYLQVIADAGISGARWVVAFDDDLALRLAAREEAAMGTWNRITGLLAWFEQHPEWRGMRESGLLAVVQDPDKGGLLSPGILDMIAVKHTPVRPVPRQQLSGEALAGPRWRSTSTPQRSPPNRRKSSAPSRAAAVPYSPDRPDGKTPPRQPAVSRWRKPNWTASTTSGATSTP
jgi:hypothetical protein